MLLESRTSLAQELEQSAVGISEVSLGETVPLPGVHFEESLYPLQGQKTLQAPANGLSLAANKCAQRPDNMVAAFHVAKA